MDHIAARVSLAATMGAAAGMGTAILKGHAAAARTTALTAFSCAMVGTACFTTERCAAVALQQLQQNRDDSNDTNKNVAFRSSSMTKTINNSWEFVLTTHAVGGVLGGALTGWLYLRRPLRGVAFLVPLMLLVGTGEKLLEDVRREKQNERQQK